MGEIKKLRFWGTSAGEGVPTPFCKCRICEHARKYGGKDLRTRSCFRLDEKIMIDAGADFVSQAMKYNEDTFNVEHILYTHTHSDHYNHTVPWLRSVAQEMKNENILNIYFSEEGIRKLDEVYKGEEAELDNVRFHALEYYKTYDIDGYKVTSLKGNHGTDIEKTSANYLFEFPDGRVLFYALDSGYYFEETFDYLKNVKLDILISECTFPIENMGIDVHMGLTEERENLNRLLSQGTIDENTAVYLTHICGVGMTHDELVEYWKKENMKCKITVAYDGLSIDD